MSDTPSHSAADKATYIEPADAVIAGETVRGKPVTRSQLARWHRAGFIPAPIRRSQGRGRGMVSLYPGGTKARLHAFCALHSAERDLATVYWRMWWAGHDMPMGPIREILEAMAAEWERFIAELSQGGGEAGEPDEFDDPHELPEAAWEAIEGWEDATITRRPMALARKRLGVRFPALARVLFEVLLGRFDAFAFDRVTWSGDEEVQVVLAGLGLYGRRVKRLLADEQAGFVRYLEGAYAAIARTFAQAHPRAMVLSASDADINRTRDQLVAILAGTDTVLGLAQHLLGKDSAGLAAIRQALQDMGLADHAMLLLGWQQMVASGLWDELARLAQGHARPPQGDEPGG